ncbi:MAG: PAQR family membrane homeostasis protein TrhA [Halorhodospira sp.]
MSLRARPYSRIEQLADRILHLAALIAAVIAAALAIALALRRGDATLVASVSLYGLALISLFAVSGACNYNLADRHSRRAERLQRLDHAAIFLMVAATYTPFTASALAPPYGSALLVFAWAVALLGIGAKLLPSRPPGRGFSIALSLLLGWSIVAVLGPLAAAIPTTALVLLAAGGALYSAGVLLYLWHRLPFHHAAWHSLVIAAAACHYAAVLTGVVLAP